MSSWEYFRSGKWEHIKEIGLPKYVLFSALTFTPIFFIGMQVIHLLIDGVALNELFFVSPLSDLLQGLFTGTFYGLSMWYLNRWMYRRSHSSNHS